MPWGTFILQLIPPQATFTEKELPDQTGKVFVVTGASSGVGKELARILYSHNAKVYVATRSEEKASDAISDIKTKEPTSKGDLVYLHLDLDDLTTIKASADEFLRKERRLDVLFNNAGVLDPPPDVKTKQGYELQLGVNTVAPFLFTQLLTPLLVQTARISPTSSVRVVWVSSSAADIFSPPDGLDVNNLDYHVDKSSSYKYGVSKAGTIFHATEYAKIHQNDGIVSVSLNPGNLKTELQRQLSWLMHLLTDWMTYPPIQGAYTELFAGLSPEVTLDKSGAWISPWGRFWPLRSDLEKATRSVEEGGTGNAEKFWVWSEEQVRKYI